MTAGSADGTVHTGAARANERALCRGSMFDRFGRLVAGVTHEGLIRVRPGEGRPSPLAGSGKECH
ncbi:hypothetical protein SAMN04489712_12233 [Thermomonospora echinospora]|uniref:Uncharacterized protein n=1 Tax=Thermomonospora echinospora TaxID=1992 RepID=A0A1H6DTL3_9ACTN|nr:hypothetical protein SAMN04489712_12233 [Thermomonospora echinospora]